MKKIIGIKERTIRTNYGIMPLIDYLDIRAFECGFDSYEELKKAGYYCYEETKRYRRKKEK